MTKNFEALKHDLLTSNYTKVFKETDETVQYNAHLCSYHSAGYSR